MFSAGVCGACGRMFAILGLAKVDFCPSCTADNYDPCEAGDCEHEECK